MKEFLQKVIAGQDLSLEESYDALTLIGNGEVHEVQIAAFLVAIQQKGQALDELRGFRNAMLSLAVQIDLDAFDAMDVCGTGGDGKDTFNISTTAAFVVAGAGQAVAKHGNHGVSSAVGSSTVLEYLGVKFTNDADYLTKKMESAGICYLHAPLFHPAMRFVGPVRKNLGLKTFFNILGPLLNPAKVKKQLTGVSDPQTFDIYSQFFKKESQSYGIVHSTDIYDEISLTSTFRLNTAQNDKIYKPEDIGFATLQQNELSGGETLKESADILIAVLENKASEAQKNAVLANAGVALSISNNISIPDGILMAKESIEAGKALRALKELVG